MHCEPNQQHVIQGDTSEECADSSNTARNLVVVLVSLHTTCIGK